MVVIENQYVVRAQGISDPFTKEPFVHTYSPDDDPNMVVLHMVTYVPSPVDPTKLSASVATVLETIDTEAGTLTVRNVTINVDYQLVEPHPYDLIEFLIRWNLQGDTKAQAIYVKEQVHEFIVDHDPETTRGTVTTPKII